MITFEIWVNGEKRFTAGGDYQILVASLTRVRTPAGDYGLFFSTSGIEPEPFSQAHWPGDFNIKVGDCIEIRIVEGMLADAPARVDTQQGKTDES
jgi:hypothetical protein